MRVVIKFVFGVLFVTSVVVGAVMLQLHTRQLKREWDGKAARKNEGPVPVRTVSVVVNDVEDVIGGTAVSEPSASASMSILPRDNQIADRMVESVRTESGSSVKKGQTLIQFDETMFVAKVAERTVALQNAKYEYKSLSQLHQRGGASALEWREAEMAVASAELQLRLAEYELNSCRVTSPLNGVVESTHVVDGMRVTGSTQLALIHQLDPIHIRMDFPMERLDALEVGQQAEVTLDAFPGEQFVGQVARISTSADTRTRVLPVTIAIPNPQNRIRAGITGYARIPVGKADATTIPEVAVIDKRDRAMVFCVVDGRAHIREVKTGPVLPNGQVEITAGLYAGEEVVIFGQDILRDNDVVNANWKEWTNVRENEQAQEDASDDQNQVDSGPAVPGWELRAST